jgi:hypothetical protein
MTEYSKRLTLKVQPDLYEAAADAAHAQCMTVAEYTRRALRAQLKLDGCAPRRSTRDDRLSAAQLLRLDGQLRELGVDLAQVCREAE